jgi:hypothetical protein
MQVVVSCPLSVPDQLTDINALEALIHDWGRQLMAGAAWQQLPAQQPDCPRCPSHATVADGTRPYRLRTVFGTVPLARLRRRCRECGTIYQPLDGQLHAAGPGRATAGLVEVARLSAASWPFATAAQVLDRLSGAAVSAEWVRQVSEVHGQDLGAQASDAAAALISGPPAPSAAVPADEALVALDGGWLASRDQPGGMEGKVAVLATGREQIGRHRWQLTNRRYVARLQSAEQFGPQVYQAATTVGIGPTSRAVALGDGAAWISTIADWCFPGAERRLDLWHLLRRAGEALRAEELEPEPARQVRTERTTRLRCGAVAEAEALVQQHLHSQVGQRFGGYLAQQRAWIVDADALQAHGEVVGSGAVEKAIDLVINRRCKGRRGMRWWRANADGLLVLRTRILNDEPLVA